VRKGDDEWQKENTMFFDHVEYQVSDYGNSLKFYSGCLIPLGFKLTTNNEKKGIFGFGLSTDKSDDLLLTAGAPTKPTMHICFRAKSMAQVDEFYRQAMIGGGVCNGPPGLRHPGYYAAFVLDPDGHNIEAVFR
jgi:catechol 2,3-dioxygenase-like lactoylglutathione lyase family enzyme